MYRLATRQGPNEAHATKHRRLGKILADMPRECGAWSCDLFRAVPQRVFCAPCIWRIAGDRLPSHHGRTRHLLRRDASAKAHNISGDWLCRVRSWILVEPAVV